MALDSFVMTLSDIVSTVIGCLYDSSLKRKFLWFHFCFVRIELQNRFSFFFSLCLAAQNNQPGMSTLDFSPSPDFPALQYLDKVDKGSMADRAGLKQGDFLLEVSLIAIYMWLFTTLCMCLVFRSMGRVW